MRAHFTKDGRPAILSRPPRTRRLRAWLQRARAWLGVIRSEAADACVLFDVSGLWVHVRQEVPDRLRVVDHAGRPSVR